MFEIGVRKRAGSVSGAAVSIEDICNPSMSVNRRVLISIWTILKIYSNIFLTLKSNTKLNICFKDNLMIYSIFFFLIMTIF